MECACDSERRCDAKDARKGACDGVRLTFCGLYRSRTAVAPLERLKILQQVRAWIELMVFCCER